MNIMQIAFTLLFSTSAVAGLVAVNAPYQKAAEEAHRQTAVKALPEMAAFLAAAPTHQACPNQPQFSSGCAQFGNFFVRPEGKSAKVSYATFSRYQPATERDVMTVEDGVVTLSPSIDHDEMAVSLYNELSSHSEEFERKIAATAR